MSYNVYKWMSADNITKMYVCAHEEFTVFSSSLRYNYQFSANIALAPLHLFETFSHLMNFAAAHTVTAATVFNQTAG